MSAHRPRPEDVAGHPEYPAVRRIVERLESTFGAPPETAVVLGSGLSLLLDRMDIATEAPFSELGLPVSHVAGHASKVACGTLGDTRVLAIAGRVHLYEGWQPAELVRAVRAIHLWGVRQVILTCSAGGISDPMQPGALALITDHINMMGCSPLTGPAWGIRFPDMSTAYAPHLRHEVRQAANELGIALQAGVYAAMMGPAYETPAEIRMLRGAGADLVGMSTVPEILAAAGCGFPAVAIAMVSNRAAGLSNHPLSHEEVTETAASAADAFASLIEAAIARF